MSAAAAAAPAVERPELDEIQGLIQQVFLVPGPAAPRSVVFASPEQGAGCTWVCAHAADTLAARIAGSVCLIDANFSNPSLHTQFGIENHRGFSESLLHPEPIRTFTRQLGLTNFYMLCAGDSREEAQPLLASDRMRLRMAELKAEFDFILIDAAALSVSTDATSIGSLADGVVLVIKANASRKQTARQAVEQLQASKANVLGAVLNRRTFPIPEAIYKRL
jgi:Mrp family chromosome partitioning ATPase